MADTNKSTSNQSGPQPGRQAESRAGGAPSGQQSPVTPALEADYWKTNYQNRSYVEPGVEYDQYAPAYRYGWEMYLVHSVKGRSFDEAEPELSRRWDQSRQGSRLTWEKAKEAVRDAWDRMAHHRSGAAETDVLATAPPTNAAQTPEKESEVTALLINLEHTCMDGVKGFRDAAEKVGPPYADQFRRFATERDQIASELREAARVRDPHAAPEKKGDAVGVVHRGWIDLKAALGGGPKAILNECERGEDAAVKAFQDALNTQSLPPDVETMLNRQYTKIKNVHDQVRDLRNAAK